MGQLSSIKQTLDANVEQQSTSSENVPVSYFRSRLYSAPYAANPLLAAACPIFSLLDRLSLTNALPPIDQLREDFKHELQAYHSRVQYKEQPRANASIAFYLIAATIDELIARSYFRVYQETVSFQAFTPLSSADELPGHQFFHVIEKIKHHPSQYLDIIEIAYFCLMAGFEGKYQGTIDGRQQIDTICEALYQLIRQNRSHEKSVSKPSHQINDKPVVSSFQFPYVAAISMVAFTATVYFCHAHLSRKIDSLTAATAIQTHWGTPHES